MQLILVACKGERVKFLRLKDVYKRFLLRADLANHSSEDTQLDVHLGCIVSCLLLMWTVSIYHDVGYLELLILSKAMREPARGMSDE